MKPSAHSQQWPLPLLLTMLCLLLPVSASANGAMSLALATFTWGPWLVYVIVTVAYEALAMGKWLQVPFGVALKCSLGANLLTALIGGFFSGIGCAFLGFYGGQLNPNPFGRTLFLFTVFGILSALVEAKCWIGAVKVGVDKEEAALDGRDTIKQRTVTLRCLVVHLVGVPVGLAVLLIPSRPYPGLESQANTTRQFYLEERVLKRALEVYISQHQTVPPVHSYGELLQLLKPDLGRFADDPDLWTAAYVADYHRFDTTEMRRNPVEWNSRASGYKLEGGEKELWLFRQRGNGWSEGFVLRGWELKRTWDPKELGYGVDK